MKAETTALVKARIRRWRDIGSGWLVVGPAKLVVYRSRFLKGPEEASHFATDLLTAVEPNAGKNTVSVTLEGPEGEPQLETFRLADRRDLDKVTSALSGLVQAAAEERKRRAEEAARLLQEAEERRREARENFAADVWSTAEVIWSLAKAGYAMEAAIIGRDWSEARRQYSTVWQQADKLKLSHEIDLMGPLKDLDEKMSDENGEEAIKETGPLLKALGDRVLQTEPLWAKWKKEEIVPASMSPNWNHLPYFLLFSAGYFETILSSQIEDWSGVRNGLAVLRSSINVLRQCFKLEFDGLLDAAESAGAGRNAGMIAETTGQIESLLMACFKSRPFEYKESLQPREGEHNGPLPEPA